MAVELAEVIDQLRAELTAAMCAGEGADLRFELDPVELELTVGVDKAVTPGAKVKFWVVELGADAAVSSSSTQRIKLVLDPRRTGQPDRRPVISGDEVVGER
jgi:Trypsin-co-occurring domain 2